MAINGPFIMKYHLNKIVNSYINKGLDCVEANKLVLQSAKNIVLDWLIGGGDILIIYGPPYSGTEVFVSHIKEFDHTLVIETFGDDEEFNTLINKLHACNIEHLMIDTPINVCIDRCPVEDLKSLSIIYRWFLFYNGTWAYKLPITRKLTYSI